MAVAEDETAAPTRRAVRARARRRGPFRDPARTFLVLAVVVGGYLALVVPHFGGIDEPAHFYRAYQISTGTFVPDDLPHSDFSGACVPVDVIRGVRHDTDRRFAHNLALAGVPARRPSAPELARCEDEPSKRVVTFSTFGSPVPYLPQATAILLARGLGAGVNGMELAARLVALAVFVVLVWVAIRRVPRFKWAFCAVGLLPIALFQSGVSASHDAVTIAVALLVVSSAIRATDAPATVGRAGILVEAAVLTALLAACKPGYVVVALCYLLPLLGPQRRRDLWPLAFAPVLGALVSVGWNSVVGDLWKTDAGFFGVAVDPGRQRHLLVTRPWDFAGAAVNTVGDDSWHWAKQLFTMGPSVAVWPTVAVVAALLVWIAVSVQRTTGEERGFALWQRVLLVLVFVVGALLVLGAQYVYWSKPGADTVDGMQARFFVPLLVLLPLAVGPAPWRWARSDVARVPVAVAMVPVFVALGITIAFRMY